jgi:hypothetical protein
MKTQGKISNSIQECVEDEIELVSKNYFNELKRKARGDFYYGQY